MPYPKGKPKSEESKRKASASMRKHYEDDPTGRERRAHFRGKKHKPETIAKMSRVRSAYWTPERRQAFSEKLRRHEVLCTDYPAYNALHLWAARYIPRAGRCDLCMEKARTTNAMRSPPFAERDSSDWLELCSSCHKFYDTRRIVWAKGLGLEKS